MNRKKILQRALALSSCAFLVLLASCDKAPQAVQSPLFTDYNTPAHISMRFPAKSKIPQMLFSIDNVRKQIYNKVYIPYNATLDSAYLDMVVSSENNIIITNETTKKSFAWAPRDTGKIDITGGRLQIDITTNSSKDPKRIAYKVRLQQYGYDPDKLTWSKSETPLPMQSAQAKVFSIGATDYWMGRSNGGAPALYEIETLQPISFKAISAKLPETLQPTSITTDHKGGLWGLDEQGRLYYSPNAIEWSVVPTGAVKVQQVLFDTAIAANSAVELTLIGHDANTVGKYYTYKLKDRILSKGAELPEDFPTQGAYTYTYELSGTPCANILGGTTRNGKSSSKYFFTADGIHWGEMPYAKSAGFIAPAKGALFLKSSAALYTIGGEGRQDNNIYRSIDNGKSWQKVVNIQEQGTDFASRSGLSGIIRPINGAEAYFLMGGETSNMPTDEIWIGYLDTKGGIINEMK